MTAQTPVFGIKYPQVGEPIRTTRQILEDNAKAVEAALLAGPASPPAAQDLATLAGRVTALETARAGSWRLQYAAVANDANNARAANTPVQIPAWAARVPTTPPPGMTVNGGTVTLTAAGVYTFAVAVTMDNSAAAATVDGFIRVRQGGSTADDDYSGQYLPALPAGPVRVVNSTGAVVCTAGTTVQVWASSTVAWGIRANSVLRVQRIV